MTTCERCKRSAKCQAMRWCFEDVKRLEGIPEESQQTPAEAVVAELQEIVAKLDKGAERAGLSAIRHVVFQEGKEAAIATGKKAAYKDVKELLLRRIKRHTAEPKQS